ncbi:sensor histidine kinase [Azospirillum oleiclasticum]|uniref:sensor histidine kinase n=1 Tax=Azospirillum oleiclasticum TaxID=2735135 RepID=UPI001FE76C03|nr:HAMP domain-containing sensor histidine kinase [Azospirillum oleiclasticum]
MRIRYRIALVGGVPVAVAVVIAVAAGLLLGRSERVYEAAVLSGSVHRHVMDATAARIGYLEAAPTERSARAGRFAESSAAARAGLDRLSGMMGPADRPAVADAGRVLDRYVTLMTGFMTVAARNDGLVNDMGRHAATLTSLTDRARHRQHASNVDLLASLTDADRRLHDSRDVVEHVHDTREALFKLRRSEGDLLAGLAVPGSRSVSIRDVQSESRALLESARQLMETLRRTDPAAVGRYPAVEAADRYVMAVEAVVGAVAALGGGSAAGTDARLADALRASTAAAAVVETMTARIQTIKSTGYSAIQDEVVQLLAYSIQANDTEQETQNVAVVALRLGQRATNAVTGRDADAAEAVVADAGLLLGVVRGLPMSPLLQDEVVAAIGNWRDSLGKTASGLRALNATLADMDQDAATMTEAARSLDETLRSEAARIGSLLTTILAVGATVGLLLGGGTAFLVARSISRPVQRLQEQMMRLADDPLAGRIDGTGRRDEFGDMARTAAFFVREIGLRERALLRAKERADLALQELRVTQDELVQAEKMAALGQLVAGVAHEINTPLGNALMGASHLSNRLEDIVRTAAGGAMRRADFDAFVTSSEEVSRLLMQNLGRVAELVQRFKQVSADQTNDERQPFDLLTCLLDLAEGLQPSWRRAGHALHIDCPERLVIDGYPRVLTQILTNLVVNSLLHGYEDGRAGTITLQARAPDEDTVELVYRDDGRGIPPNHLDRVFDPFFTTRRAGGSTGLGLHIVYNLVTARLGGRVTVDSEPGRGVRFVIRFPRRVVGSPIPAPIPALTL